MSMTEAEIRKKIASLIREKKEVFLMIMRPLVTMILLLFAA